jgi:hypothetical protein
VLYFCSRLAADSVDMGYLMVMIAIRVARARVADDSDLPPKKYRPDLRLHCAGK